MNKKTVTIAHLLTLSGVGMAHLASAQSTDAQRPNILVIMTDQLRADLVAREGYSLNTMPFTDQLAYEGSWFNRAYTSAPASSPARASMLTGRFPKVTNVRANPNLLEATFSKDLFDVAREQGYKTALVGKNHSYLSREKVDLWKPYMHDGQLTLAKNKSQQNRDFDDFLKSTSYYTHLKPAPGGVESQLPYRMVNDASRWIKALNGDPFMMWFSIPEPHNPYQTCEPYFSMFPPETLPKLASDSSARTLKGEKYETLAEIMALGHKGIVENMDPIRSIYHGMMRMIDDQLARLIEELKDAGVYENTIIVFLSDHGDYVGEYGLMKKGVGLDDVLTRIPMVWHGPGIVQSDKPRADHVSIVDILPTVCEIIGAEIPLGVQGRSLWPMLRGEDYPVGEFSSVMAQDGYGGQYYTKVDGTDYIAEGAIQENSLFFDELNTWSQSGSMRMLRQGDWKLVMDMEGNGRLYNLVKDPMELNNLYDSKKVSKVRCELTLQLLRWEISTEESFPTPKLRYHFKRNAHNYMFSEK